MDEFTSYTPNFPQFQSLESNFPDHGSNLGLSEENEPSSVTRKQSTDSTSNKIESGEQVTQNVTRMDKKRKCRNGSSLNSGFVKGKKKQKKTSTGDSVKDEDQKEPKIGKKKEQKKGAAAAAEEPPTGYIHVRARRGQATDSHSLAERVRREKISERMNILQKLVPGCEKVTGKAQMLDEIINYVQSLQNQVEFLSMKLASLNPFLYDFGMDMDATFMVRPDQRMAAMVSPLPQCSPTETTTAFAETTTTGGFTITPHNNNYTLLEATATLPSHLLQSQDNGNVTWDVLDDQRQKLFSSSVFNDSLCSSSFH